MILADFYQQNDDKIRFSRQQASRFAKEIANDFIDANIKSRTEITRKSLDFMRDEIESLFDRSRAVDLYSDAVLPCTDWPTIDYSIKSIARYLGFSWRDKNPSGAESIEWYNSWAESRSESIKQRILDYNEDDCRAMRVLLDALKEMSL